MLGRKARLVWVRVLAEEFPDVAFSLDEMSARKNEKNDYWKADRGRS